MSPQVAHPRALAAVRFVLAVVGGVVTAVVLAATLGFLFVVGFFGVLVAVLTAESVLVPALVLSGAGLALAASLLGALLFGLRRVERAVVRADRVPTPVEVVRGRYVAGELDEHGLERELEAVLDGETPAGVGRHRPGSFPEATGGPRLLERESDRR